MTRWPTKTVRTWALELFRGRRIVAGINDVERLIERVIARTRLDEAMACGDLVVPDGNPIVAIDKINARVKLHVRNARRQVRA